MKLLRTSIQQTGVAIVDQEGNIKQIPLYSNKPCAEARKLGRKFGYEVKSVFYTNSLMDYRIEDCIRDFKEKYGFLPENYIEEIVSGFPFIPGMNESYCYCYK